MLRYDKRDELIWDKDGVYKKLTSEAVVPDIWAGRSGVEPVVRAVEGSLVRRLADNGDVGLLAAAALVATDSDVVEAQSHAVTHWKLGHSASWL